MAYLCWRTPNGTGNLQSEFPPSVHLYAKLWLVFLELETLMCPSVFLSMAALKFQEPALLILFPFSIPPYCQQFLLMVSFVFQSFQNHSLVIQVYHYHHLPLSRIQISNPYISLFDPRILVSSGVRVGELLYTNGKRSCPEI
jgi:hypothetical protein